MSHGVREILPAEFYLWDEFIDHSPQGNVFSKTWWITAVSNNFKILVFEEGNEIIGGIALPFQYKYFFRNPKLTPTLGMLFKDFSYMCQSKKESKEIEIMNNIINSLPSFKMFDYGFSYHFKNWLPFKWKGFNIDVTYTYVLDDLTNYDKIYEGFKPNIKSDIKKAVKNGVKVVDTLSVTDFYNVNQKTFRRQSVEIPYDQEFITQLDEILASRNARKILFAVDQEDRIHAVAYLLLDKNTVYYLMGGGDPELRNSGATSLLISEAIKYASMIGKKFDFEGSSIPNIEMFFRAFGGEPKAIFRIYKGSKFTLLIFNLLKRQKNILRKIGLKI